MRLTENGLCILFLYHKYDELTLSHFESLRQSNPMATIVPIADSIVDMIPGTMNVGQFPSRWDSSNKWRSCDSILYRWFENRRINAEKYILLEYDCLCTVDLKEHLKEVWDSDVAPVNFYVWPKDRYWYWFREINKLKIEERAFAAGISPFTCCLFSHTALEKIVAIASVNDVYCELRLGSAVNQLGLKVKIMPPFVRKQIFWHIYPWKVTKPGLYHAIKSVNHNESIPISIVLKRWRMIFPLLDLILKRFARWIGR